MGGAASVTNFENGGKVARFTLATDRFHKSGEKIAEWHRVFAWGDIARFIERHGKRGKQLAIHGRLVNRTYLNKDGKEQKINEIEVKHVISI